MNRRAIYLNFQYPSIIVKSRQAQNNSIQASSFPKMRKGQYVILPTPMRQYSPVYGTSFCHQKFLQEQAPLRKWWNLVLSLTTIFLPVSLDAPHITI